VIPFFAFPPEVRRVIYTTNAIESLNAGAQDHQDAGPLPDGRGGHQADLAGAAQHHGRMGGTMTCWKGAMNQFAILYGDRFIPAITK
jgi:putative transposase